MCGNVEASVGNIEANAALEVLKSPFVEKFLASASHSSGTGTLSSVPAGVVVAGVVALFSTHLPFWLDTTHNREASTAVYRTAFYRYDPEISHFDNTILTYGTDYGLALAMILSAWYLTKSSNNRNSSVSPSKDTTISQQLLLSHEWRSRGMLLTYMLSVTAGAVAHQFFNTIESRNTWPFRLLWTICVGSVTAASGWMGSIASAWAAYDQQWHGSIFPVIPVPFWVSYSVTVTVIVMLGGWSYQRPAADIFVAGITQFPSTFYVMTLLWRGLATVRLSRQWRWTGMVVFILNAPLLPLYPLLVYCTDLSLGQVNAVLHTNLLLAWSGQGRVLKAVAAGLDQASSPPPRAVPVMKQKVR
jgi:hypothetical protein